MLNWTFYLGSIPILAWLLMIFIDPATKGQLTFSYWQSFAIIIVVSVVGNAFNGLNDNSDDSDDDNSTEESK